MPQRCSGRRRWSAISSWVPSARNGVASASATVRSSIRPASAAAAASRSAVDLDDLDQHVELDRPVAGAAATTLDLVVERRPGWKRTAWRWPSGRVRPEPGEADDVGVAGGVLSRRRPLPPTRIGRAGPWHGGASQVGRASTVSPSRSRRIDSTNSASRALRSAAGRSGTPMAANSAGVCPAPRPELDPTAAQVVQRGDLAGQQQWVVEAGVEHERADADALGRRGRGGEATAAGSSRCRRGRRRARCRSRAPRPAGPPRRSSSDRRRGAAGRSARRVR